MHSSTNTAFHPVILIPAYKPDARLPQLLECLREKNVDVLVVDDGGGPSYEPIFEKCVALGVPVVRHAVNLGKGRALKTGLNEILMRWPDVSGVVTADADGQHTPEDIQKVIDALRDHPDTLIVGGRAFSGQVPWKSRAGNAITRVVYRISTGIRIHDTQTGLRGIPKGAIPQMLPLAGERYEYEMNMLLKLREWVLPVCEIPIETVYIDDNSGSHFSPLRDAIRIYRVIFRYLFSALVSFGMDYLLYLAWIHWFGLNVTISYGLARILSSLLNYKLNKHTVFGGHGGKKALVRYYLLVLVQMGAGMGLTTLLVNLNLLSMNVAKLPVDILLFCISYFIQRDFVFRAEKQVSQPNKAL